MNNRVINNVIFDIGNVMVQWSPVEIVRMTFGESALNQEQAQSIFGHSLWLALNQGEITESEAKSAYCDMLGVSSGQMDKLFYYVKHTQVLLPGSLDMLKRIRAAGYRTFALTDNVHEIVAYLKQQYDFWPLFDGAIVSAEVGCMKPGAEIFGHLLEQYQIIASESVFLDDVLANVEGARNLGFHGIQFVDASQGEKELKLLGVDF